MVFYCSCNYSTDKPCQPTLIHITGVLVVMCYLNKLNMCILKNYEWVTHKKHKTLTSDSVERSVTGKPGRETQNIFQVSKEQAAGWLRHLCHSSGTIVSFITDVLQQIDREVTNEGAFSFRSTLYWKEIWIMKANHSVWWFNKCKSS